MSEENASTLQKIGSLIDRYRDSNGNLDYFAMLGDQSVVAYAESLVNFDLDSLHTRNEQLAFWINCYNALSIYGVIKKLKADPKFAKSGNKGWFQRVRFFAFQKFKVGGRDYTLRGIENFIRSEFEEPRVHFALNCSAMGCPLLKNGLYSAENLENELEEAARLYIQSERGSRLEKDQKRLHLSMIFKWYTDDFKVTNMSIVQYVARYHQAVTAQFLLDNENDLDIRYIDYDFALNMTAAEEE
ncbi:MAG: DUF547 domain-containing protein [Candidatus Thorarchaeota archaeon]